MQIFRFLVKRLLQGIIILLVITVINFFLIRLAPGDPAQVMAGEAGAVDEIFLQQLREQFGLTKPLLVQLATYVGHVGMLDFGFSYRQNQPVILLIWQRLPATLYLTLSAFVFALLIGISLGIMSARRAGSFLDRSIRVGSLVLYAMPVFWLALMLILVFSIWLDWLPSYGMVTIGAPLAGWDAALDVGAHLILPALALAVYYVAIYTRITRASMLNVADQDFINTAKAKGLRPGRIVWVHMLRNALLPVITLAGIQGGNLLGGAILTETVFAWPGIGRLMFDALMQRDYNLLLGTFFATAAMAVIFNILVDFIYTLVDPRIALK